MFKRVISVESSVSSQQAEKAELDGGQPEYTNVEYAVMLAQVTLVAISGLLLIVWAIFAFEAFFDPRDSVLAGLHYLLIPAVLMLIAYFLNSASK